MTDVRVASFADLRTTTLYALLKLRCDVFVVEQQCCYAELDGRDTEPGTRHVWLADGDDIVAYLRILDDGDTERIGRVLVAPSHRGAGHARRLTTEALDVIGNRPSVLSAQSHLEPFYVSLGYQRTGPDRIEDGIPHLPMLRAAPR